MYIPTDGNPGMKRLFGRNNNRWEDYITMNIQEKRCKNMFVDSMLLVHEETVNPKELTPLEV